MIDAGAHLRALYARDGGVHAAFTSKVADYVASRPDYPDAIFDLLAMSAGLRPGAVVADIGAGTGLLSEGLLARGAKVIAVEPNAAMRSASERILGQTEGFRAVEGAAEATSLHAHSVDLITAAQAFHWFDVEPARREALRILTPEGVVALIWNDRLATEPLQVALDAIFLRHGGERREAMVSAEKERAHVPQYFNGAPTQSHAMPHMHRLDEAGLLALAFSRSYMPARDTHEGAQAAAELREVFASCAQSDGGHRFVTMHYTTIAIIGRPRPAIA
jgi:ubiquinone/menaquinone biosynthesis C-methylase UbiE